MTPINAELVVGGSYVQAEAGHEPMPVTNPANQAVVGYAPVADPRLVDEAVTRASEAFPTWSTTPPHNVRAGSSLSRPGSGPTGTGWPPPDVGAG